MLSSLIRTGTEDRKQVDQVSSGHFRDSLLVEGMGPSYPPADVAGGHSSLPRGEHTAVTHTKKQRRTLRDKQNLDRNLQVENNFSCVALP